jgi:hypothetical protein
VSDDRSSYQEDVPTGEDPLERTLATAADPAPVRTIAMARRSTLFLNLLIVLSLVFSGLLVGSPVPEGARETALEAPEVSAETTAGPALAEKRAKRKEERREDRRQARQQDRKQDRKQADKDRQQAQKRQDRQRDRKRANRAQVESRVGDWTEHCDAPEAIRLRKTELCTHGPDPAPKGFDEERPVQPLSAAAAGEETAALGCDEDGERGYRTQVLYVHAADVPSRYDQFLPSIRAWAAEADQIFQQSAAETGGLRRLRFVQDPQSCVPTVEPVVVSPLGDDNFDNTIDELWNQGYGSEDRIYLAFVDADLYCGVGTVFEDERPTSDNWNNIGPSYSRVDAGCWSGDVAAHELMHNLGAVQLGAPHTSNGFHCIDEYDVMCYRDGPSSPAMRYDCTVRASDWTRFDCNHDDYFNTNPADGSYLDTHWNPTNNQFLIADAASASPPPPPPQAEPAVAPPPPPPDDPIPPPDPGKKKKKDKKGKKGKGKKQKR